MPIFEGDGTGISTVYEGDGTGIQTVYQGDGTVLWSGEDPEAFFDVEITDTEFGIPDSVTDQWRMDEGSGTTLVNTIGSVDASLTGAGWESDSDSVGGYRTTYDGTDDYASSDSQFAINQSQMTALAWFTSDEFATSQFIMSSVESNDGWRVDIQNSSTVHFSHRQDGVGNNTVAELDDGGSLTAGKRYLAAMAMDGDSADCYLYDNAQLIDSGSGTGQRGTDHNSALYLATRIDLDYHLTGTLDAPALARGTQMPQSEIDDYHAATSP